MRVSEVYGVPRHDLAGLTRLAPVFKHELLGSFRVAGAPCKGQRGRRTDHLESKAFAHDRGIVAPVSATGCHTHDSSKACDSVILTKRIPVTAICSLAASQFDVLLLEFGSGVQEEHARLLTKARQVCTQPLAAMRLTLPTTSFNAKLGKLLHLPHPQSSSTLSLPRPR